jgi:hypothetical protein
MAIRRLLLVVAVYLQTVVAPAVFVVYLAYIIGPRELEPPCFFLGGGARGS